MPLSTLLSWLNPKARRAQSARSELMANAEKALRMKQEAHVAANIPPHQTAHEGMRDHTNNDRDHIPAREGYFTPEMKRTKVARSGDAS